MEMAASGSSSDDYIVREISGGNMEVIVKALTDLVEGVRQSGVGHFYLDAVRALAHNAHHFASVEQILRLWEILPNMVAYIDIRVREAYFELMKGMFMNLGSSGDGMQALMQIYHRQNDSFQQMSKELTEAMDYQYDKEQKVLFDVCGALFEEEPMNGYQGSKGDNFWLFCMWLSAKRACTDLLNEVIANENVFEGFEPLLRDDRSPLLRVRVKFGDSNEKRIILAGVVKKKMDSICSNNQSVDPKVFRIEKTVYMAILEAVGKIDDGAAAELLQLWFDKFGDH